MYINKISIYFPCNNEPKFIWKHTCLSVLHTTDKLQNLFHLSLTEWKFEITRIRLIAVSKDQIKAFFMKWVAVCCWSEENLFLVSLSCFFYFVLKAKVGHVTPEMLEIVFIIKHTHMTFRSQSRTGVEKVFPVLTLYKSGFHSNSACVITVSVSLPISAQTVVTIFNWLSSGSCLALSTLPALPPAFLLS